MMYAKKRMVDMSFLDSMSINGSALTALRLRMDVIAQNMANVNTTRTANEQPYRRRYVVFQQIEPDNRSFASYMNKARRVGGGVRVTAIGEDDSPFKLDYDPSHPDANEEGYVELPNVEVVQEMVDMMSAYRAYEANITALNTFKDMALKTLEIGK
jgi:flagellar basal-body rod protein FlgC